MKEEEKTEHRSAYYGKHPDKHPLRDLAFMVAAGVSIFMVGFFILRISLQVLVGFVPDPSVWNFYWLMALAGGVFGFERWWSYEQGPYNPFHEREAFTES